jgi:hypothetical protein
MVFHTEDTTGNFGARHRSVLESRPEEGKDMIFVNLTFRSKAQTSKASLIAFDPM